MKVPKFKSLKEKREFWDSHDSTDYHDDFKITNTTYARMLIVKSIQAQTK